MTKFSEFVKSASVNALKSALRILQLPTTGTKAVLKTRLQKAVAQFSDEEYENLMSQIALDMNNGDKNVDAMKNSVHMETHENKNQVSGEQILSENEKINMELSDWRNKIEMKREILKLRKELMDLELEEVRLTYLLEVQNKKLDFQKKPTQHPVFKVKCYNSNQTGHTSRKCSQPKRSEAECFKCGVSGQKVSSCPNDVLSLEQKETVKNFDRPLEEKNCVDFFNKKDEKDDDVSVQMLSIETGNDILEIGLDMNEKLSFNVKEELQSGSDILVQPDFASSKTDENIYSIQKEEINQQKDYTTDERPSELIERINLKRRKEQANHSKTHSKNDKLRKSKRRKQLHLHKNNSISRTPRNPLSSAKLNHTRKIKVRRKKVKSKNDERWRLMLLGIQILQQILKIDILPKI